MCIKEYKNGVIIKVRVIPRSAKSALVGERGDSLVIKLTSPPVEGRANRELVKFLGKRLRIAPTSITLLTGESSREKTLLLSGLDADAVRNRLRRE